MTLEAARRWARQLARELGTGSVLHDPVADDPTTSYTAYSNLKVDFWDVVDGWGYDIVETYGRI